MGSFDYLCVPLICPRCGATHDADGPFELDCQTKVRRKRSADCLRLGEHHDLLSDLTDGGYLAVAASTSDRAVVRVVDEWVCNVCHTNYLWVKATWRRGTLEDAHAVRLTEDELRDCDFVSDRCTDLAPLGMAQAITNLAVEELRIELAKLEAERWAELT
jgi:hypothetical protein